MKCLIVLFAWLGAAMLTAGAPRVEVKNPDATKIMPFGDLRGVNLRVEGATFRKFNLHFPEIQLPNATMAAQNLMRDMRRIIDRDLALVGSFNYVTVNLDQKKNPNDALSRQKGVEGRSILKLALFGDQITATIAHKNLITGKENSKKFLANSPDSAACHINYRRAFMKNSWVLKIYSCCR